MAMGPSYGPLPSLQACDVRALGFDNRLYKAHTKGPCNYPEMQPADAQFPFRTALPFKCHMLGQAAAKDLSSDPL